jgi:hypothetical protein
MGTRNKAAVETAIAELREALLAEISNLRAEVAMLREKLEAAEMQNTSLEPTPAQAADALSSTNRTTNYADVVKAVKSALSEENVKKDVVINLPENKADLADVNVLCQKTDVSVKPSSFTRIGKRQTQSPSQSNRPRPLKMSFPTPFDARTFMAKLEAYKKDARENDPFLKVRCRPCRSPEEQARHAVYSKEARKLNEAAKANGIETESYSLRKNGDIWKFAKTSDHWKRVPEWVFKPTASDSMSENAAR